MTAAQHQPVSAGRLGRIEVPVVLGGQFVQLAFTFVTSMLIARTISADGFGQVNLLRTLFVMLSTLSPLGLDVALLKFCGRGRADDPVVGAVVRRLRLLVAFTSLGLLVLGGVAATGGLVGRIYPYEGFDRLFMITLAALPFGSDIALMGAVYKARGQAAHYALMTLYLQTLVRVGLVVWAVLFSPTVATVVWINTVQIVICAVVLFVHDRRTHHPAPASSEQNAAVWRDARVVLGESAWMALSLLLYGVMRMVDVLFLGAHADARSVGEYTALSTVAQLIQLYPLAASQSLGPNVSRLFHAGDIPGVQRELSNYMWQAAIVAGFLFAGIAVFGDRLDLVFGSSFHFQPAVCFLLPLGQVLSATLAPTGYALSMTGHHRIESWMLGAGAGLLVLACALLVPAYGQLGAASATCFAFLVTNLLRFGYVAKVLGRAPGRLADVLPPVTALALALAARWIVDLAGRRDLPTTLLACVLYTVAFAVAAHTFFLTADTRMKLLQQLRLQPRA